MQHKKKLPPKKKLLDQNTLKHLTAQINTTPKSVLKHPIVAIIVVLAGVYTFLYLSTYFITAMAQLIKACKLFKQEWTR